MPLKLFNTRKFDYKTLEVWGEFLLEAIDPCHRRLMTFFDVWKRNNASQSIPDFFLWLEDKNVPRFFPTITLVDEKALPQLEIFIKNNIIYDKSGKTIDRAGCDNEFIFIITPDLRILACTATESIRHTSLSHYRPILGAGALGIKNGNIVKLSFDSGHYIPQIEHFIQIIKILENKSLVLDENLELIYYKNFERIISTVGKFKKLYMSHE